MRLAPGMLYELPGYAALAQAVRDDAPDATQEQVDAEVDAMVTTGWETGQLWFLAKDYQLPVYDWLEHTLDPANYCVGATSTLLASRRFGKTHAVMIKLWERALRKRELIRVFTLTQKQLEGILDPIVDSMQATMPTSLRPQFRARSGAWHFANGSVISVHGMDRGSTKNMRGFQMTLAYIDEAGFIDPAGYRDLVKRVISPIFKHSKGVLLVSSTPPAVLTHPFIMTTLPKSKAQGRLMVRTVHDMNIDPALLQEWLDEEGGPESPDWKREYLVMLVGDSQRSCVASWPQHASKCTYGQVTDSLAAIKALRPHYFQDACKYFISLDFGFRDGHGVSFCYFDPRAMRIVVEFELATRGGCTTPDLSKQVQAIEANLYGNTPRDRIPCLFRIADHAQPQTIADLCQGSPEAPALYVTPCQKTLLRSMLDHLEQCISRDAFRVHAGCTDLRRSLANAQWTKGSDHQKSAALAKDEYGHHDVMMSVVYAVYFMRAPEVFGLPPWTAKPLEGGEVSFSGDNAHKPRQGLKKLAAAFSPRRRGPRASRAWR